MARKIEIPDSINQQTIESVIKAMNDMSYTDKELGETIAVFRLVGHFASLSRMGGVMAYWCAQQEAGL